MIYETGKYQLIAFDEYSRRDRRFDSLHDAMTPAVEAGNALQASGDIDSCVVVRVLYNSKDTKRERWEGK